MLLAAPPALFDRLKPYQGILYSAQQINLTCRVECSPLCSIIWKKNGRIIDFNNNPLYYNKTIKHDPDLQKNIFESIESTLVSKYWIMVMECLIHFLITRWKLWRIFSLYSFNLFLNILLILQLNQSLRG